MEEHNHQDDVRPTSMKGEETIHLPGAVTNTRRERDTGEKTNKLIAPFQKKAHECRSDESMETDISQSTKDRSNEEKPPNINRSKKLKLETKVEPPLERARNATRRNATKLGT
jgi:hypothetical protein